MPLLFCVGLKSRLVVQVVIVSPMLADDEGTMEVLLLRVLAWRLRGVVLLDSIPSAISDRAERAERIERATAPPNAVVDVALIVTVIMFIVRMSVYGT